MRMKRLSVTLPFILAFYVVSSSCAHTTYCRSDGEQACTPVRIDFINTGVHDGWKLESATIKINCEVVATASIGGEKVDVLHSINAGNRETLFVGALPKGDIRIRVELEILDPDKEHLRHRVLLLDHSLTDESATFEVSFEGSRVWNTLFSPESSIKAVSPLPEEP